MAQRSTKAQRRESAPAPHIECIARGLLVRDARVLLCLSVGGGYGYLPGGHVEFGEPASAALQRELLEELGLRVRVGPPLLVHEYAFVDLRGATHHELNTVFHVEARRAKDLDALASREADIRFEMVPIERLPATRILPTPMKRWLIQRCAEPKGTSQGLGWLSSRFPRQSQT
ncbi:MAG: hypothetical protein C0475_07605 [Planctomyces sp.]|nr:hypothetical protein [Planctomyces sp.]MBA4039598.1 hypothetical protein [Planctomyces sp.]